MSSHDKPDIDRLTELANIGAGHAAGAFAALVGRTIWSEVPVVVDRDASSVDPHSGSEDPTSRGVFFEFDGCLDVLVGILFPADASEAFVRQLVGIESDPLTPETVESALMEVGNILASHVASAIADTLADRLLPSIPTLALEDAEEAFFDWLEARLDSPTRAVVCGLHDETRRIRGRLVLVPRR